MNAASFVAPTLRRRARISSPRSTLGLFARDRLAAGQAIGEIGGPQMPVWMLSRPEHAYRLAGSTWFVDAGREHDQLLEVVHGLLPVSLQMPYSPAGVRWPATYAQHVRASEANARVHEVRVVSHANHLVGLKRRRGHLRHARPQTRVKGG